MESDSTLSALALAISLLVLVVSELGVAAISSVLQGRTHQLPNGASTRHGSLSLVTSLPGGPTATLRLVNRMAFAAAMISVAAIVVEGWGLRWDLVSIGAVVGLLCLVTLSLVARSAGIRYAEGICTVMPRIAWLLSFPLRPLLIVQSLVMKTRPGGFQSQSSPPLDFAFAVDEHDEPLDEHEMRMIRGIVQLDKTVAREIMVPRVDIVAVEAKVTLDELVEEMNSAGHSRVPVFAGDLDHVEGVAHARDVLQQLASGQDISTTTAGEVCREPLFIPESKTLEGLLEEFQERQLHLAVVVDEYGGVSGIVTIEDLLEEIVGEIRDEFDSEEPEIQRVNESEFVVDARTQIDELNRALGVEVVGDGFDTIGGFVFDRLGKIPVPGDTVRHDGLIIEVLNTIGRRPTTLRIIRVPVTGADAPSRERDRSSKA